MHTDEAVHAVKFGEHLEISNYQYDPNEYHGPTLNYATLISAKLSGISEFKDMNETLLRIIPVAFSFLLLFFLLGLRNSVPPSAILWIALFTALSPSLVFYSRYYIQEILLVGFTFATIVCALNWYKYQRWMDVRATGFFLGLMHATKETAIIAWGAMGAALIACWFIIPDFKGKLKSLPKRQWLAVFAAAAGTSMLFYSSFLSHPQGIIDSIKTYAIYFNRASAPEGHHHPWHTYLKILGKTEIGIALVGFISIGFVIQKLRHRKISGLLLFWTVYTVTLTATYTLMPYKTPWSMLGFWHGWIVLAGWGIYQLLNRVNKRSIKIALITFICLICGHMTYQSIRNFGFYGYAPENPLTYSQPGMDVVDVSNLITEIVDSQPRGEQLYIEVISPALDYWPLPWYLRRFQNVGWWNEVNPETIAAPVILVHPDFEEQLIQKLYTQPAPGQRHLYLPLWNRDITMRPGVILKGFIRKDIWDRYNEAAQ